MQRSSSSASAKPESSRDQWSHQSKRRRVDVGSDPPATHRSGPSTPTGQTTPQLQQRQAIASNGQETAWVLKTVIPDANGHTEEDSEEDIWSSKTVGRQRFGQFTRKRTFAPKPAPDDADADLSSASEDEVSDDEPALRSQRAGNRSANIAKQKMSDSPLRAFAQQQDRKRKSQQISKDQNRKKARRTM